PSSGCPSFSCRCSRACAEAADDSGLRSVARRGDRALSLSGVRDPQAGALRMTTNDWLQLGLYTVVLTVLAPPLGAFMARVLEGKRTWLTPVLGPLETASYRLAGVDPARETGWRAYAVGMLLFNGLGVLAVYALQRVQALLPLNPQHLPAVTPHLAFNTAVSF